ncbi:MAG: calcium/sodium antiporter [Flavobacteriaceae bacterium]
MELLAIVAGLFLLIKGGDWLLESSVGLSLYLSIPRIVIGMTVVSFATSAPELIVSLQSAVSGHPDLALGNVVGSNIANIAFVLAITILISPIQVTKSFYQTDWPMMFAASLLFYFFLWNDQQISSIEGGILFSLLLVFLFILIRFQKTKAVEGDNFEDDKPLSIAEILLYFLLGAGSLWLGSESLVKGAVSLAQNLHVSERIISISIISVGTSIPELSASIIAVLRKEKALSLGNLIGSNMFNILAVMGLTALVHPIAKVDNRLLTHDIFWMLGISLLVLPLVFVPSGKQLGRFDGVLLFALYLLFLGPMLLG